jgi:hypothetical protein
MAMLPVTTDSDGRHSLHKWSGMDSARESTMCDLIEEISQRGAFEASILLMAISAHER